MRLCRYLNVFTRMKGYGIENCLSDEIAQTLKLTPAQVRKDFSVFKLTGKKKAGYRVCDIIPQLTEILSRQNVRTAIVAGMNPLGIALMTEQHLLANQVNLIAAFAENDEISSAEKYPFPVLPYSAMNSFVKNNGIKYAVIATANEKAQRVLDRVIIAGIKNILSFSTFELRATANCNIHNINIAAEFDNMVFFGS